MFRYKKLEPECFGFSALKFLFQPKNLPALLKYNKQHHNSRDTQTQTPFLFFCFFLISPLIDAARLAKEERPRLVTIQKDKPTKIKPAAVYCLPYNKEQNIR